MVVLGPVAFDLYVEVEWSRVGRDYTDVPPTRGVFKGSSAVRSELAVAVAVGHAQGTFNSDVPAFVPWMSHEAMAPRNDESSQQQQ